MEHPVTFLPGFCDVSLFCTRVFHNIFHTGDEVVAAGDAGGHDGKLRPVVTLQDLVHALALVVDGWSNLEHPGVQPALQYRHTVI